jgi:hypothetical protein
MSRKGKKQARQKQSTRQLIGIKEIADYCLRTG